MGHILGANGLQADPEKIKAVCDMPCPTEVQGVQRLIGVVTYLSKFLPQLSTICEPFVAWQHEDAFARIKELITQAPVLHYFDINKEVTIECDSSDVGLGDVLTQDGYPVAYASWALTQTERNYGQIEKECLAIVFTAERFEHYILGKDTVQVLSDHKPLMATFTKPILTSPKRLQRMKLRLQKYPLKVTKKLVPKCSSVTCFLEQHYRLVMILQITWSFNSAQKKKSVTKWKKQTEKKQSSSQIDALKTYAKRPAKMHHFKLWWRWLWKDGQTTNLKPPFV